MLTAHFSTFSASHCFLNSSDFFRFSRCCSLNFFLRSSLACLYFSSACATLRRVLAWKSSNFDSNRSCTISFCAGWSSLSCFTKCYLLTLSNFYFEICSFFRGERVLFMRLVLLKAFAFVFYNCCISDRVLFWVHRAASWRRPTACLWFWLRCWSRRWLWGPRRCRGAARSFWSLKPCRPCVGCWLLIDEFVEVELLAVLGE